MDFLPPDRQLFAPFNSLGEALRAAAKAAWPWNTANHAQRRWKLDPTTAENLCKGTGGSARTVVKAVQAEGDNAWVLWDALGELIIGESREEYDERMLAAIIAETQRARQRIEDRRTRRLTLEARAYRVPDLEHRSGT